MPVSIMIAGAICFASSAISFILSVREWDAIVKHQYLFHREEWRRDGSPRGYIWKSPEPTWSQAFSRDWQLLKLLFISRPWIDADDSLRKRRWRLRVILFLHLSIFATTGAILLIMSALGVL
ncbi:MAG: hypothetical protein ACO1RA_12450 [Planctomycetaceae bacterium]